ncbi:double-strand break repair protein MRE11A, variant [Capsaspora owczarzaki ATCC 30864]|uniref:Double-strand break repair protein MRE11A, variant n=1 Tax=Capsaspora owczarzaki (strain ATCC 30864) TaxID=595528 RepID=A0A0D2X2A5_CAPO3|nr:double-strand break repair protein MRE11A, variant [Capsaspora owczarzaki ATCC 30864]
MSSKRSSTASTSASSASGASRRRARVASDSEQDESPMDSGLTESHASGARHATRGGREQTDGGSRAAASSAAFSGGSAHLAGKVKHASKHDDGDDDQAPFNAGQRAVQQARSQESQQANAARHRDKRARQDDSSDGEHPANLNNHGSTAAAAAAAATTSSSTGGIKTSSSQSEKSSGYGGSRSAGRAAEHASANGQAEGDDDDDDDEANIMSILITTDNHIGYLENDPIRGNDSFMTFEEILLLAQEENVDFILLGGDLFHENKPSRNTLHNTIKLLRNYCMGDRPCSVQVLSDPKQNFPSNMGGTVNYLDPNFNIGMPIFTIHGNHDDPASDGLSAMDLLSGINLVNYFGRVKEIDNITVSPVLLQKGQTKLALFGLGAVRDERLHRTFNNKQVQMLRPEEDQDEWFNMFVLHQNRCKHGPTNYIPEVFLDDFLDLVLWGHEHECRIQPEQSTNGFEVIQPGSSIATSLAEGESVRKHVGILRIKKRSYALKTIPLRTVRPFYMQDIVLSEEGLLPSRPDDVVQVLADRVNELIAKCDEEHGNDEIVMKPLIRLRVEYSGGFQMTNIQRFGQQFVERVANPKDLLQFYRRRASHVPGQRGGIPEPDSHADEHDSAARQRSELDASRMQDLVNDILARSKQPLELLSEQDLGTAVHAFVEKDEKEAIRDFVKYALEMTQANLIKAPKDSIQGEEDIMASVRTNRKEHYKARIVVLLYCCVFDREQSFG